MSFSHVRDLLAQSFENITANTNLLFTVSVDRDELYNLYLESFPEGTNPIFRTHREFDCSECRHFLKRIGPTVWIDDDLNVHSLFEFDTGSPEQYQPVMDALSAFVKRHPIDGIFVHYENRIGAPVTHALEDGRSVAYAHFSLPVPPYMFVNKKDIGTRVGSYNSTKDVFKRSLDEISMDAIDTVLELISSNTLYRGEQWASILGKFRSYKKKYEECPEDKRNLFCWKYTAEAGEVVGHMRNHSIGQLLLDISGNMELDAAVRRYEQITAPANYQRPKPIFTKRMLEEAQKKVEELGLMDSLPRRYATLDDITVNNILFANRDVERKLSGNVFESMRDEVSVNPRSFSKVEEIPIDRFVSDVLPTASSVEVLMQGRLAPNLVSVIAPKNAATPGLFKWNNGFSWAYKGNMTDSDIRGNVKSAGGKVDGVLRFSIQWNDGTDWDENDEDAHCIEPNGHEIYYADKYNLRTGGNLDVDIINPVRNKAAVENITWPDIRRMDEGTYKFFVHCFSCRGGQSGFRAEIEFDGTIYSFDYSKPLRQCEKVYVADVTLKDGQFAIREHLDSSASSHDIWNVKTNQFVPVSVIMYSPNYWDEQNGIGNRHYIFALKGCVNPEKPNGFYNEFLRGDLMEHRKVFEALGPKMAVEDDPNQLSGLGFCSTRRNEVIVRVSGNVKRVMKIKF